MKKMFMVFMMFGLCANCFASSWTVGGETSVTSETVGAAANITCDLSFAETVSATLTNSEDDVDTTGDITSGSASVSDISVYGLSVGMFVIDDSDEIPVDTKIESIDSASTITLSENATGTTDDANLTFLSTTSDTVTVAALRGITGLSSIEGTSVE